MVEDGHLISRAYPTVEPIPYSMLYSQFARALAGQGDVPVKVEDASAVIRLIELAKQSSSEGRTVNV